MMMVRKQMRAHSHANANSTPEKTPASLDLSAMKAILEEQKFEMIKALVSLPKNCGNEGPQRTGMQETAVSQDC